MRESIYRLYHKLQQNTMCFGFITWLQEHYVTTVIGDIVNYPITIKFRKQPEKYLRKSRDFFEHNASRVDIIMGLLEDDESRSAYNAAIKYRTERRSIRKTEWSLKDQYFVKDIILLDENEVFVDCGAYNGDTIAKLFKYQNRYYKNIHIKNIVAFEPSEMSLKLLHKKFKALKNVLIIPEGLSDKSGELYFNERGSSSHLTDKEHANKVVKVSAIDDVAECYDATFIKMDIEGAEWDALHGASETIKRNKPKLTICIYHSDEDMVRLAEYIHELVPEYKLYIRQHTRREHETVLYAVC